MKLTLAAALLFLICGCSTFSGFLADVGSAAQGQEVGKAGSDTTAERIVDVVEVVQPTLPPVVGYVVSAVLSGLAVYSHLAKKSVKP